MYYDKDGNMQTVAAELSAGELAKIESDMTMKIFSAWAGAWPKETPMPAEMMVVGLQNAGTAAHAFMLGTYTSRQKMAGGEPLAGGLSEATTAELEAAARERAQAQNPQAPERRTLTGEFAAGVRQNIADVKLMGQRAATNLGSALGYLNDVLVPEERQAGISVGPYGGVSGAY
jgi:hypothetical protein